MKPKQDNIIDRVAKSAIEKHPPIGKCKNSELATIITIAVKSFLKNKGYADIGEKNLGIVVKCILAKVLDAAKKAKEQSNQQASAGQQATTEAIFYHKDNPVLTEGWKELAMAGAIAAAPMASHAATAESAPLNTHQGTSKVITNNRSMSQDSREMVNTRDNYGGKASVSKQAGGKSGQQVGKTSTPAKQGGGASEVPVVSDYSSVSFDSGTTYQVTPDQLKKMKLVGNVPAKYQVLDKNAKSSSSGNTAKAASSSSGKSAKSVTQNAAKQQAKTQTKAAAGRCTPDAERCGCGGQANDDIDWKKVIHKGAHDATDAALTLGGTAVDAAKKVPGTLSKIGGFLKKSFLNNKAELEDEHDKMIQDRELGR